MSFLSIAADSLNSDMYFRLMCFQPILPASKKHLPLNVFSMGCSIKHSVDKGKLFNMK